MEFSHNPPLESAFEYVTFTNKNLFLTGKAGTGKTTFLHQLKQESPKRLVIAAPTGVAAINAGGMTLHALFQLPFGLYLPDHQRDASQQRRFTREKIALLQGMDLLVIDEISMVRADTLDAIDAVLRRYKNRYQPFGGVQLLMIGDLHQLPPVVKEDEWALLSQHYETPYFFSSRALQQSNPLTIELTHIYRQQDETFIRLLNTIRENRTTQADIDLLNTRYIPDFDPPETEPYITLSSHNSSATSINENKLLQLKGQKFIFKAELSGNFPENACPADTVLELKAGAQVMFIKNDTSKEKKYYNGKIGFIHHITQDEIQVACPGEATLITVTKAEWKNLQYSLNENTKEITETELGSFTQYPLRLAWAITIHKSQGLTFDRAIIDAKAAFAHGQVYVALSRCKRFEGIVLQTPILPSSIHTDHAIRSFSALQQSPNPTQLLQAKKSFQSDNLLELFSFKTIQSAFRHFHHTLLSHENALLPGTINQCAGILSEAEIHLFTVSEKFLAQLQYFLYQDTLPEDHAELQERVRKAQAWFSDKISPIEKALRSFPISSDNKEATKACSHALLNLNKELFIKNACLQTAAKGFASQAFLRARSNASIDFEKVSKQAGPMFPRPGGGEHSLFGQLKKWRDETAAKLNIPEYMVLSTKSMMEIAEKMPDSATMLKKIKGFGDTKVKRFGQEILAIIRDFQQQSGKRPMQELSLSFDKSASAHKKDTRIISLELFREGKSVADIAETRGLGIATIYKHANELVAQGALTPAEVIGQAAAEALTAFMEEQPQLGLTEAKARLEDKYSYEELRLVRASLNIESGV
jgi:Trp operon repressor